MPEPIQTPASQGGAADDKQSAGTPPQPSIYKDLQTKKGFKSEEDLAKSYVEAEQELGRKTNLTSKVKQQLETAGYTINDAGDVIPVSGSSHYQAPQIPSVQQQYQQPQEVVYDPYTGQQITDPISLQLAKLPVGQREALVVNAILEQRDRQQTSSYQAEAEILSKPEAKGFEDDVKDVMRSMPLQMKADKKNWEDALLRVKGMKYDQALRNASQQGVEQFVAKEGLQMPQGTGGDSSNATLSSEQEQVYRYYQQNMPGLFKDKAAFARANRPDGGR
jgi:hypothetical protein